MNPIAEVWVSAERLDAGLELLSAARQLAEPRDATVTAITIASGAAATESDEYLAHGADRVLRFVDSSPEAPGPDRLVEALVAALAEELPLALLLAGTCDGTEVAARVAQRLGLACATGCLHVVLDEEGAVVERRCLGRFLERQRLPARPAILTLQLHRFEAPPRAPAPQGSVELRQLAWPQRRTRVTRSVPRPTSSRSIRRARTLIAVGRGLRQREDLLMIERLAEVLEGAVVASRPLTDDLGWLPVDLKIGLSGQTVRPELYIACGISGQIEHVVGMREARVVVAINRDPEAPFFREADYRIVGDLYEVVPALTRVFAELLGQPPRDAGSRDL